MRLVGICRASVHPPHESGLKYWRPSNRVIMCRRDRKSVRLTVVNHFFPAAKYAEELVVTPRSVRQYADPAFEWKEANLVVTASVAPWPSSRMPRFALGAPYPLLRHGAPVRSYSSSLFYRACACVSWIGALMASLRSPISISRAPQTACAPYVLNVILVGLSQVGCRRQLLQRPARSASGRWCNCRDLRRQPSLLLSL